MTVEYILVIRHGALGDVILNTPGFAAIRARHPQAHIVCLTSKTYADLMAQMPYFDEVWVDKKPRLFDRKGIVKLRQLLRSKTWAWVYDLQTSTRSTAYQWLLPRPWPQISNISRWSSHGYTDKARHTRHAFENLWLQLKRAGFMGIGMPDLSWLKGDIAALHPKNPYALLVPGGAAHRPEKRWPADQYAALAQELVAKKITPVLIGTKAEVAALESIATRVPQSLNLCGHTDIGQVAELARGAALAVGNDTGPMHIIAACNCPSVVLFSYASNPDYSAPIGDKVKTLRERDLRELSVDKVLVALAALTDS